VAMEEGFTPTAKAMWICYPLLPSARQFSTLPDFLEKKWIYCPVRREKARSFSGCNSHPATVVPAGSNWSSRRGNEAAEASGVEGR
jgi:hypothetical protein